MRGVFGARTVAPAVMRTGEQGFARSRGPRGTRSARLSPPLPTPHGTGPRRELSVTTIDAQPPVPCRTPPPSPPNITSRWLAMTPNSLYLGDDLKVLRDFPDERVDLQAVARILRHSGATC